MPNAPLPEGLRLREHRVADRDTPGWFTLTNFGGIGDGCNMAFRRAAFGLWSGFDERLGRGSLLDSAEEHLSFFQLVLLGFRCVHTPRAVVWHPLPEDLPAWRRYNRHNMTNAIAYAALLWSEFPETRLLLLRHMYERSFGPRARARAESGVPQLSLIEKLRVIRAGLDLYSKLPKRSAREVPLALPTYEAFAAQK